MALFQSDNYKFNFLNWSGINKSDVFLVPVERGPVNPRRRQRENRADLAEHRAGHRIAIELRTRNWELKWQKAQRLLSRRAFANESLAHFCAERIAAGSATHKAKKPSAGFICRETANRAWNIERIGKSEWTQKKKKNGERCVIKAKRSLIISRSGFFADGVLGRVALKVK